MRLIKIRLIGNKITSNNEKLSFNCRFTELYYIINFAILPYYAYVICIFNICLYSDLILTNVQKRMFSRLIARSLLGVFNFYTHSCLLTAVPGQSRFIITRCNWW